MGFFIQNNGTVLYYRINRAFCKNPILQQCVECRGDSPKSRFHNIPAIQNFPVLYVVNF